MRKNLTAIDWTACCLNLKQVAKGHWREGFMLLLQQTGHRTLRSGLWWEQYRERDKGRKEESHTLKKGVSRKEERLNPFNGIAEKTNKKSLGSLNLVLSVLDRRKGNQTPNSFAKEKKPITLGEMECGKR